jgi:hypothetical protein
LGWAVLGLLLGLGMAALLGRLVGQCAGYVSGFVAGTLAGDVPAWMTAGAGFGAAAGQIAFPVLLLLGWVLVRSGQRHHEAALARNPRERPPPPPAVVRSGLLGLLGVLGLSLSMVPAALGIWLGGVVAGACGAPGPWALALSGAGGVLGLAVPFLLWRRAR